MKFYCKFGLAKTIECPVPQMSFLPSTHPRPFSFPYTGLSALETDLGSLYQKPLIFDF